METKDQPVHAYGRRRVAVRIGANSVGTHRVSTRDTSDDSAASLEGAGAGAIAQTVSRSSDRVVQTRPPLSSVSLATPPERDVSVGCASFPPRLSAGVVAGHGQLCDGKPSAEATFASRLNRLIAVIHPPGRGPYRNRELVELMYSRGRRLSEPYLCQLRLGKRTRPSQRIVEGLAEIFRVSPTYLYGTSPSYSSLVDRELAWLEMARDDSVRYLTTRILELPPQAQEEIVAHLDRISATGSA